jgi:hypothetical protein
MKGGEAWSSMRKRRVATARRYRKTSFVVLDGRSRNWRWAQRRVTR